MKTTYLYGAMTLGLLFTACKSDDLGMPDNPVMESDQTLYINMNIRGDISGTRAASADGTPVNPGDFDEGTDQENAVNNAYFVFYDEDGNVVGDLVPVTLDNPQTVPDPDGTVNTYYKSVIPVSVRKGEKKPTGVICYINPISPSSLQTTLSNIQTVHREQIKSTIGGKDFFAMSNSVYYANKDAVKPEITVQIKEGQLFTTEAAALEADESLTVDIYVERYASKLTFTAEEEGKNTPYKTKSRTYTYNPDGMDTYEDVDVVLTFVPQYWALNARANKTYVIKSFRREAENGTVLPDNYSFALLNNRINLAKPEQVIEYGSETMYDALSPADSWTWNAPSYHRSYWGMSPAYFQNEYPEVASDVEKITMPYQDYLSYGELESKGYKIGTEAFTAPHYFKETTVGTKALNSKNPAAAVASVIYVGQYKMTVNGTELTDNPNFYTYLKGSVTVDGKTEQRPFVYFDSKNDGTSVVPGGESMLRRFCAQSTILYTKNAETGEYEELGLDRYNLFIQALEVAEIKDKVKEVVDGNKTTALKLKANTRSLQFKSAEAANNITDGENNDIKIYIASGDGYKTIVADNNFTPENDPTGKMETASDSNGEGGTIALSKANSILMQQVGYAYYYSAGKAYFNIPVRHFGWYRTGNDNNKKDKDGNPVPMNWNLVRVGDFGMVRNHSYKVEVNKITGLADGINGDSTPIVPPAASEDYYVSYRVNILKWAVVPAQGVDL